MVFGEVISVIEAAFSPKYMELALADAVVNGLIRIPISLHLLFIGEEAVQGDNSKGSGEVLMHLEDCDI